MNAEQLEHLQTHGYVILRNFIEPEVVAAGQKACNRLTDDFIQRLVREGKLPKEAEHDKNDSRERSPRRQEKVVHSDPSMELPLESRLLQLLQGHLDLVPIQFRPELHIREIYPLLFDEKILDCVEKVIGTCELRLFPNYTVRPKLPNFSPHRVAWHQDAGLTGSGTPNESPAAERLEAFGPGSMVNCWTSFVPVSRANGCMLMVPGSHHEGCVKHVAGQPYREGGPKEGDTALVATHIDPQVLENVTSRIEPIPIETNPGDLVLFTNLTFHCGLENTVRGNVRWTCDWRYQDASKPTHRPELGYLARSSSNLEEVPRDADAWEALTFR